jgi:hypothetical protein
MDLKSERKKASGGNRRPRSFSEDDGGSEAAVNAGALKWSIFL